MSHTAELIAVGTELLLGNIANTDAQMISEGLSQLGINVYYHTVVGDNPERVRQAVDIARQRADILITTGGLGPTCDDLTKVAVAQAFGRTLVYHEPSAQRIRDRFAAMGRPVTENNFQQAMIPEGATVLDNDWGTAPGCAFTAGGVTAVLLPGVPSECRYLAEHCLLPYLEQRHGQVIRSHDLRIFGLTEPQVQELLADLLHQEDDLTLAPFALPGEVSLHLSARAADETACEARMAPLLAEVRRRLGGYLYGEDVSGLEEAVFRLCRDRHLTLSAAESCTGGLIAKRLTDLPGASQVFLGGVVSYTNGVKNHVLGVPASLLESYGAVSAPVARAMAMGIRVLTGSDLALSVTGLAGPDGDDRGNPVGTVYVGLSWQGGSLVRHLTLGGDRARIRLLAASNALDIIRRHLCDLPVEGEEAYGS